MRSPHRSAMHATNWNALNGGHQALVDIVLGLVYVIVGLLLVLQMLMRLAMDRCAHGGCAARGGRAGYFLKRKAGRRPGTSTS